MGTLSREYQAVKALLPLEHHFLNIYRKMFKAVFLKKGRTLYQNEISHSCCETVRLVRSTPEGYVAYFKIAKKDKSHRSFLKSESVTEQGKRFSKEF